MRDGVKLAADITMPDSYRPGEKIPALLHLTRYFRSSRKAIVETPGLAQNPDHWKDLPLLNNNDKVLLSHGYAIIDIDVRGTGASYGTRTIEWGPTEARDHYDVADWVTKQPWSNHKIGAYGISYPGTNAELLAAQNHPAVKAIFPWGGGCLDHFKTYAKPYGLSAAAAINRWGTYVKLLDNNQWKKLGRAVRPVDADIDGKMLTEAITQHAQNTDVARDVAPIEFIDQKWGHSNLTIFDISTAKLKDRIEKSHVAMFKMCSWFDGGLSDSNILEFLNYSNPMKIMILGSNHGGRSHASPYMVSDQIIAPLPSQHEQWEMAANFFDHYLKGADNGVDQWPAITYFNLGEEVYKETNVWPPAGTRNLRLFLQDRFQLSTQRPVSDGDDKYTVDFGVTTGSNSRWTTGAGGPVLNYDDRSNMDKRMLCYTSSPMVTDLQITGHPVITLYISSDHKDGAIIAYFEDVDQNGKSRLITEGGLRVIHRKESQNSYLKQLTPYHSFKEKEALPLVPGEIAELAFEMIPTSVLIKKGHRIRIAIAGADKDNFDRIPQDGNPILTIFRDKKHASFIDLPSIKNPPLK
jgi:putative CocE/NonD family hydrolase